MKTVFTFNKTPNIPCTKTGCILTQAKRKIYKKSYRPSSNPFHFIGTLFSVILVGSSPAGKVSHYQIKKSR